MVLSLIPKRTPEQEFKRIFELRYSDLLRWAMQLTHSDRSAAEELVHDAYVDLATGFLQIDEIANLDGYLYRVLRNLNASRMKRAWKHEHDDLDVLEYDSLHLRLRLKRGADQIDLQDQLMRLCAYLCMRKKSFRPASILLLRFFRGFYPDEIQCLAGIDAGAVRKQMERARREARAFLNAPEKTGVLGCAMPAPGNRESGKAVRSGVFVESIFALIRDSRTGECFAPSEIQRIWASRLPAGLDTALLDHLVSCEECLDAVCEILKMNPPDDRYPFDSVGQDREASAGLKRAAERTIRDLYNHEPNTLVLAVNGDDVAEFEVDSTRLRYTANLRAGTAIEFVEVFSGNGLRLLRLDGEDGPPHGPSKLHNQVTLGSGRILSIVVELHGHEPWVRVEFAAAPGRATSIASPSFTAEPAEINEERGGWFILGSLLDWLRKHALLSALASAAGIILALAVASWRGREQAPGPLAILNEARTAEATSASKGISHRVIAFEKRDPHGQLVDSGRIDIWDSGNRRAKRFYDSRGRLVAGEWRDDAGKEQHLKDGLLGNGPANCASPEGAWSCDLSAQVFESNGTSSSVWTAERTNGEYVVTLTNGALPESNPAPLRLVRATLRVDRRSMRSRQADLWISAGNGIQEYRYVELSYEPHANIGSDSPVFHPDIAPAKPLRHPLSFRSPAIHDEIHAQLAHLQLQALLRLHALGEDAGQRIIVERRKDEQLSIHGVLPSDQEAQRIRAGLADLANDRLVKERIYSVDEIQHLRQNGKPTEVDQVEVAAGQSPAHGLLRTHFESLGYREQNLDDQIAQYTQTTLSESAKVLQQAWNLREFSSGFDSHEVSGFTAEDKKAWFSLLSDQANSLNESLRSLRHNIDWILSSGAQDRQRADPPRLSNPPVISVIEDLLTQATELDHRVRALLLVSVAANPTTPLPSLDLATPIAGIQSDLAVLEYFSRQYLAVASEPKR